MWLPLNVFQPETRGPVLPAYSYLSFLDPPVGGTICIGHGNNWTE